MDREGVRRGEEEKRRKGDIRESNLVLLNLNSSVITEDKEL